MPEPSLSLELCQPVEQHARLVMAWRNDAVTRANSYHHEPKVWDSFWPEFRDDYFSQPMLPPMFVLADGERVGFLRYQPIGSPARSPDDGAGRTVAVSLAVAPGQRGRGIGAAALRLGSVYLQQVAGIDCVIAEIRVGNTQSRRAFTRAGYRLIGEADTVVVDTGERCRIARYVHDLSQPTDRETG